MKVLCACEESQAVCKAFRAKGHEAYSCDIQECSGGHPEWHIMCDVALVLDGDCSFSTMDGTKHCIWGEWDLIIGFPPCTDLASSGARHFRKKRENGVQEKSISFFMQIAKSKCKRIAIENPIGIMSRLYRKPDQIIQPWEYALFREENTEKSTCLWLKGLPKLVPIHCEKPKIEYKEWINKDGIRKRQTLWYYNTRCMCKEERGKTASKTFPGIAMAMAEQWGNVDSFPEQLSMFEL